MIGGGVGVSELTESVFCTDTSFVIGCPVIDIGLD